MKSYNTKNLTNMMMNDLKTDFIFLIKCLHNKRYNLLYLSLCLYLMYFLNSLFFIKKMNYSTQYGYYVGDIYPIVY